MKKIDLAAALSEKPFFRVIESTPRGQVAVMCLEKGQESGPGLDAHPTQDQWLYVLEGEGIVRTGGGETKIGPGDLYLIPSGEPHQVIGASEAPLRTIDFYSPPAY